MRSLHGLMILAAWAALAGCRSEAPPAPAVLPLAGQTVELLVPADLVLKEAWEPLLQEWHSATGGAADWAEYDPAHPPWKDGSALGNRPNGGRVVLVPLTELSEVESAGVVSAFPSEVVDAVDQKDIFPGLRDAVLSRQKKLIAAPVSAPALLCYYRKDLLEAAGRTPPRTWDEYQQLLDDLPNWAPGLSAFEPCGPEFRASLFLARSAAFCKHPQNYSVWFDIQSGTPLFDNPGFERALETARHAWSNMPAEIWTMTPAACRRAILTGQAALTLTWEPSANYPRSETSAGEAALPPEPYPLGAVQLPGTYSVYHRDAKRWDPISAESPHQPGFTGFTGLVMGASAGESSAAAWNLLQVLTKHQDQAFVEQPRSPCREAEVLSPLSEDTGITRETASLIVDATAETLRRRDLVCDLAIPAAAELRQIIAAELDHVKDRTRETKEILAAIQERIRSATEDRREVIRDAYRRSLGLPPLK